MLQRLLTYRILHYDPSAKHYTTHPLIRAHYFAQLTASDRAQAQKTHEAIKDYYLELAGDTPYNPTLDDLMPLIEVVHHACRAGAYDEAHRIRQERIYQSNRRVLVYQLGAWETALTLMYEFFPNGDTSLEPQVSSPGDKSWILNEIGRCLMSLGDLSQAVPFYERMIAGYLAEENLGYANVGYQNLAELHAHLGALTESAAAAREALRLARRVENKENKRGSLNLQAWAAHLRGDLETACEAFRQAEILEREIDSNVQCLTRNGGIWHAGHLRQIGNADYARKIIVSNIEYCKRNRWTFLVSRCHRVLGDLDALRLPESSRSESARGHYDGALKIARSISRRDVLIEALLARGRWFARHEHETPAAFSDLREALDYALNGGYRIYETDIRIALAWAHLAALRLPESARLRESSLKSARAEAQRALQMSTEMGYYWGKIDAKEVLEELQEKISR
jgi:tetratricopeptide (TPR) repeat protein